jgi:hypothetical protein
VIFNIARHQFSNILKKFFVHDPLMVKNFFRRRLFIISSRFCSPNGKGNGNDNYIHHQKLFSLQLKIATTLVTVMVSVQIRVRNEVFCEI